MLIAMLHLYTYDFDFEMLKLPFLLTAVVTFLCYRAMSLTLKYENVWTDKAKYDDAERQYYEGLTKVCILYLITITYYHI